MANPAIASAAHTKLALYLRGLRATPAAREELERIGRWHQSLGGERSIELLLPEGLPCLATVLSEGTEDAFLLDRANGRFSLRGEGQTIEIEVPRRPAFYGLSTSTGRPMGEIAEVLGAALVIGGSAACSYSLHGGACRFCRVGSRTSIDDSFQVSLSEVVEVARAAFAERVVEFVLINTGQFDPDDGGAAAIGPFVRAVKRHCNTFVAVQLHPPHSLRWIDKTYALGVDAVSYSLEVHEPGALERHYPGRARYLGRSRYLQALRYAATIFPRGAVWSEIVVGLEPVESTREAINELSSIDVLPILVPYRNGNRPQVHPVTPPSLDTLAELYAYQYQAVCDARIALTWLRDLSFLLSPLEARFFAGDGARAAVAAQRFYQSRLGALAARNLARLRRHLRIRPVDDGTDAAHG